LAAPLGRLGREMLISENGAGSLGLLWLKTSTTHDLKAFLSWVASVGVTFKPGGTVALIACFLLAIIYSFVDWY
jgi:hypothetical protein